MRLWRNNVSVKRSSYLKRGGGNIIREPQVDFLIEGDYAENWDFKGAKQRLTVIRIDKIEHGLDEKVMSKAVALC